MQDIWTLPGKPRCVVCKGTRNLCGKDRCPILVSFYARQKTAPLLDSKELEGSTPPSVFVGRTGYPKVYIGPMVPPVTGDTALLDQPENWLGIPIEEIADFRLQLVRGKYLTDVNDFSGRIVEQTQEIAMAKKYADIDVTFKNKPTGRMVLDDEVAPFGPSAQLDTLDIHSIKAEQQIEKAYYDRDLKAREAVRQIYLKGIPVSQIQKAFSVGLFGLGKNRKFVPTRWSITAVDDTIANAMLEKTKTYPVINEYRVYEATNLDNHWTILLMPREWCYEVIEAWYPKTAWNPAEKDTSIMSSHEFFKGRRAYPEIGGSYFSAKLAVNELLNQERRQAGVVMFREILSGYILPVGVWNVRETVRDAFRKEPVKFATLGESLKHVSQRTKVSLDAWLAHSNVLKDSMNQRRIADFYER